MLKKTKKPWLVFLPSVGSIGHRRPKGGKFSRVPERCWKNNIKKKGEE